MARVILDGYNLLLAAGRGADDAARAALVREAARFRGERGVDVTVVFDARQGSGIRAATAYPGVSVLFARGEADAAILDLVRLSPAPRDLLVVTSDRRLAAAARDLGARVESGPAFAARRDARRAAPRSLRASQPASRQVREPGEAKPRDPSRAEVEEWLRRFAERAPDDDDEAG
jgi:predicted RNA-binding protein with PIN domain